MDRVLPNGAVVLQEEGDIVLCKWERGDKTEYVTWNISPDDACYWGHYFPHTVAGKNKAVWDYCQRVKKYRLETSR